MIQYPTAINGWQIAAIRALFATAFSLAIIQVPWADLQGYDFVDRANYLNYFLYDTNILEYRDFGSIVDYIKNEALWHYLVPMLSQTLDLSIEDIFDLISFFALFTFSFYFLARSRLIYLPLLINPLLVTLSFDQLRIALAFSIVLLVYITGRKALFVVALFASGFIHTAAYLLAGIALGLYSLERFRPIEHSNKWLFIATLLALGFLVSFGLGIALSDILTMLDDRRAGLYSGNEASGIKFTVFWTGLLCLFSLQKKQFFANMEHNYAFVVLAVATFNLFTGGYTSRLLALSLPMVIVSMLALRTPLNHIATILYTLYLSLQWIYWLPLQVLY